MASLNQLKRPRTLQRASQRVGRGQGSGRGKQSGRGGKGQTARAGAKIRPAWRDIIKKLPKRRGFGKNRGRTVVTKLATLPLSVETLEKTFQAGDVVSRKTLKEHGMLNRNTETIKIVAGGDLTKKLSIEGVPVSTSARTAIEKAGGSVS